MLIDGPVMVGQAGAESFVESVVSLGNVSGNVNIDLSAGSHFILTLTGATQLNFINGPANKLQGFTLELTNGGAYALTYADTVRWSDGTPPSLSSAGLDFLTFFSRNGTVYNGVLSMKNVS